MKKIITLVLILTINTSINAQSINDSITVELTKLSKNSNLVGFGVAIVNKDSIVYAKGFGYDDKDTKTPYTIQTVQPIASISKTFLAVALMQAQEMGKLHLNDDINDHLPFKIYNPNFPNENITIQQLVNHTSSILDGDSYDRTYIFKNRIPPFYNDFTDNELKTEVKTWVEMIGLDPAEYGTHSLRRTKVTLIYKRTKNLRAIQLLLGHTKLESTVRYLGIEVDDALEMAEQTEA